MPVPTKTCFALVYDSQFKIISPYVETLVTVPIEEDSVDEGSAEEDSVEDAAVEEVAEDSVEDTVEDRVGTEDEDAGSDEDLLCVSPERPFQDKRVSRRNKDGAGHRNN